MDIWFAPGADGVKVAERCVVERCGIEQRVPTTSARRLESAMGSAAPLIRQLSNPELSISLGLLCNSGWDWHTAADCAEFSRLP